MLQEAQVDIRKNLLYNASPQLHCMWFWALGNRPVERQGAGSTERSCCSGRHLMVVDEGWGQLPEYWRGAFRQAWAAYVAGTIPVGAVMADGWAVYTTLEPCPMCAGAITVAFRGRVTVGYASGDPTSGGLLVLTDTDIGRRRQWQVQKLRGPFAVFAELLHAVYTVEARPMSLTAARYREPPWWPLIETAGAVIARERDRGASVEQVVATIWAAIEHAQVDPASDLSSEVL